MEQLNSQQFEARQELAKINGEISTGKARLIELNKNIEKFLELRKIKEKEALNDLYNESKEIVDGIQAYQSEIKSYYVNIRDTMTFLTEMSDSVKDMLEEFEKDRKTFKELIQKETEKLSEIRKDIENDREILNNTEESLKRQKEELLKEKGHITSQQETIKDNYQTLKKIWKQRK